MRDSEKSKSQLVKELSELRQTLGEWENKYKLLFDNLPQKLFMKDKDFFWLGCNENFARDLNLRPEDIVGKTDYDLFPKALADKYRADDQRIVETGQADDIEEEYIQDGRQVIVNTIKIPMRDREGNVTGILGVFWDVTKYKLAEIHANRRNAVLNAINRIFKKILSAQSEEDLALTCLNEAEQLTQSEFGYIGEINPAGSFDTIALSNPGWDACKVQDSEAGRLIRDMEIRGIWGRVLRDGTPLIANEPGAHEDGTGIPEGHPPINCFLGVPLKDRSATTGMIALANKPGGYEQTDEEDVEALSISIVEALRTKRTENKVAQQAQEILELSTPVIQVWEGVVIAPLIGMLDSERTYGFMERFLERIVATKSSVAMVDITGVPAIDTQTAQHLIESITAAKLLGTQVILTGVRPSIAQTLVHLGIDLSEIETCASLAAGLRLALNMLDLKISDKNNH